MDKKQLARSLAGKGAVAALSVVLVGTGMPTAALAEALSGSSAVTAGLGGSQLATAQSAAEDDATSVDDASVSEEAIQSADDVEATIEAYGDAVAFATTADLLPDPVARPSLADGTYSIRVEARNASQPQNPSMSNGALVRQATLQVSGGKATLVLDYDGMDVSGLGREGEAYLGAVYYYGGQDGKTKYLASVLDYQLDAEGNYFTDGYSKYLEDAGVPGYPNRVEIPLDDVSLSGNFYRLAAFVPVMEDLGQGQGMSGMGYQDFLLNVDWDSAVRDETAPDVSELAKSLAVATSLQKEHHTDEDWAALQKAIADARAVYANPESQDAVNAATTALDEAVRAFQQSPQMQTAVNKGVLVAAVVAAKFIPQGSKTDDAYAALQKAIEAADAVYKSESATQDEVNAAVDALMKAVTAFNTSADKQTSASKLDKDKLENGTYYLSGTTVKATNHAEASMSANAFSHRIKLVVSDGTGAAGEVNGKSYRLVMDFNGMQISGKTGYLGALNYFEPGYAIGDTSVTGTTTPAEVLSVQKDSSGNPVTDDYTSLLPASAKGQYPDEVSFPIYQEGVDQAEGFVPVQVFVPVMESISAGAGTQTALLKLDWSTLTTDSSEVDETGDETEEDGGNKGKIEDTKTKSAVTPTKKTTATPSATKLSTSTAKKATASTTKKLPQTGDPSSLMGMGVAAVSGASLVAGGIASRVRAWKSARRK